VGCKVVFDDEKCEVFYKNNIILRGYKDPTTDLWTLPIFKDEVAKTTPESILVRPQRAHMMLSHHVNHTEAPIKHAMVLEQPSLWVRKSCDTKKIQIRPGPCLGRTQCNPIIETAGFSYAQTTKIVDTQSNQRRLPQRSTTLGRNNSAKISCIQPSDSQGT